MTTQATTQRDRASERDRMVLKQLRKRPRTCREIAEVIEDTPSHVYGSLWRLAHDGKATATGRGPAAGWVRNN